MPAIVGCRGPRGSKRVLVGGKWVLVARVNQKVGRNFEKKHIPRAQMTPDTSFGPVLVAPLPGTSSPGAQDVTRLEPRRPTLLQLPTLVFVRLRWAAWACPALAWVGGGNGCGVGGDVARRRCRDSVDTSISNH
jgi:hypothetical protein